MPEEASAPITDGSRFASRALPVVGLVIVSMAAFWPLVRGFPEAAWADGGDGAAFLWNYWNLPRSILRIENPFRAENLFFPVGAHTVFNTNTPLLSVASWPVQQVVGLTGASIILGLSAVVGSAVAAYLLARRAGCGRPVAFFAGVAFALLPWRTNRIITHLNLIHTEFVAFALVGALAFLDRPSKWRGAVLGALGAAALLVDFNTGTMAVLAVACVFCVRWREALAPAARSGLVATAAVGVMVALPLLIPLAIDLRSGEAASPPGLGGAQAYSADVLSWVLPHPAHPLWGKPFEDRYNSTTGQERFTYIGITLATLALVGALTRHGQRRLWLVVAGVFVALSFGPALHVDGWTGSAFRYDGFDFSIPMPYLLLHQIPGFAAFRAPARFASVAGLALVVLAAIGLQRLIRARPRLGMALPVAAILAVIVEFLPPTSYQLLDTDVDPVFARMRDDPSVGAVLDIPLQFRTGFGTVGDGTGSDHSRFMYGATRHERAMAGGSVSRLPDHRLRALQDIGVYRQILTAQGAYGTPTTSPSFDSEDLEKIGIRFVVYHHDSPVPAVEAHLATLGLSRYSASDDLTVWKVPDRS